MEDFKNNEDCGLGKVKTSTQKFVEFFEELPENAWIFSQKSLKFIKGLPEATRVFIKNAPEMCWAFLKTHYRNPVFYFVVMTVILSAFNIALFKQVKDLEGNLDYTNSELERVGAQANDLEDKIEEIEDKLESVESVAHRHYYW